MTVSRIISVAAMAAFVSFGAQAGDLSRTQAGDMYGAGFDAQATSTQARSTVKAQAAHAVTQFKNYENPQTASTGVSTLSRSNVRSDAIAAARAGHIASGDLS